MADENERYRKISKNYRKHFGLSQEDVAELMNIKQNAYSAMETGRGDIDLEKADKIAKVYGLRYFQMGDPKQRVPSIENLPSKTKKRALERQAEGKKSRNDELQLPIKVTDILNSGKLPQKFTSADVWELLPEEIKKKVKAIRITDLFNKGQLKNIVEETGEKRGREKLYRLK